MTGERSTRPWLWIALWAAVALAYALILKPSISRAYLDFGDGNYQYISWRLNQGVRLYTDILSPQPPFHLWIGSLLHRLAEGIGADPLVVFRWFTVFLRMATSGVVGLIAWTLFGRGGLAILASSILLLLPEGYRWSQGYQSEHLELFFLCLGFWLCLLKRGWSRMLAPCLGVCAMWTNMSSLPFALLLFALAACAHPFRWGPLVSGLLALLGLLGLSMALAGEAYLENVWSNQVASIPSDWRTWVNSLTVEGTAIIQLEGLFILLALLSIYRFLFSREEAGQKGDERGVWTATERALIALYGIASIGSAIYVIKGGTVDYIFMLAEPAIAVFAAKTLVASLSRGDSSAIPPRFSPGLCLQYAAMGLVLAGLATLLLWNPVSFNRNVAFQSSPDIDLPDTYQGRIVEYSDVEVRTLEKVIDSLSEPGETIWAPPFFAALTSRPIALDLSETYLWYVRWQHSVFAKKDDPAVNRMIAGLTDLIEGQQLPMLLLNSRTGQWGQLVIPDLSLRLPNPEGGSQVVPLRELDPRLERLQSALEREYQPILAAPGSNDRLYFQGMNERLEIWVPKTRQPYLPPWSKSGFSGS